MARPSPIDHLQAYYKESALRESIEHQTSVDNRTSLFNCAHTYKHSNR